MRQELRRALRALIRARRVTVTAVTLFAIAAGGTTAVFAVVDAVLLRPLPYRDAGQLVQVRTWDNLDHLIGRKTGYLGARTGENADNLRSMTAVFEAVGGYGLPEQEESVERNGVSERGMVGRLGPGLLKILGLSPIAGREFTADDARPGDVAVIGETYWRRAFGADASALGRPSRCRRSDT